MTDLTADALAIAEADADELRLTIEHLHTRLSFARVEIEAHLGRCEAADQRARSFGDLLATIADEAFGPFPIQSVDENIAAIERGIHDGIRAAQELAAIRDIVAPGNPQGTVVDAVRAMATGLIESIGARDAAEQARDMARDSRDAAIARAEAAERTLYSKAELAKLRAELAELRARPVLTEDLLRGALDAHGYAGLTRKLFAHLGPVTLPSPAPVDPASEIARLRALGLEACDVAIDSAPVATPTRIEEIRKELTRG